MTVQKFVSDIIKVGVSDYVGVGILDGHVFVQTFKNRENRGESWISPIDQEINVTGSYTNSFIVPANGSFQYDLKKLSSGDSHLISMSSSGTDENYPDFAVENFEGIIPYTNKSCFGQRITFTIVPINSHATSSYNVKLDLVKNSPDGLDIKFDRDSSPFSDYPIGLSGPYIIFDKYRHKNIRLDISYKDTLSEIVGHETILSNSYDSNFSVFDHLFNNNRIDKVEMEIILSVYDQEGLFNVVTDMSKLPSGHIKSMYQGYSDLQAEQRAEVLEKKNIYGLSEQSLLETISSNDTTPIGTSGGY